MAGVEIYPCRTHQRLKISDIITAITIQMISNGGTAHKRTPGITNHNGRSLLFIDDTCLSESIVEHTFDMQLTIRC